MNTSRRPLLRACALGLAACSEGIVSPTRGSTKGPSLIRKDTGMATALQADELLTVTLDAQASTGYGWQVESIDGTVLRLAGQEHISAAPTHRSSPSLCDAMRCDVRASTARATSVSHPEFGPSGRPLGRLPTTAPTPSSAGRLKAGARARRTVLPLPGVLRCVP